MHFAAAIFEPLSPAHPRKMYQLWMHKNLESFPHFYVPTATTKPQPETDLKKSIYVWSKRSLGLSYEPDKNHL